MDKEFYNLAVKLMDNIRQLEPNLVSSRDAELCVLMTDSEQIYAGITGVKISAGQLMRACPEYNAIMAMIPEGESRVRKLITVSFAHREVSQPCEGCLALLCRVNKENRDTEIYIASNRAVPASELMPEDAEEQTPLIVPVKETAEIPVDETFSPADEVIPENERIETTEIIDTTAEEIAEDAQPEEAAESEPAAAEAAAAETAENAEAAEDAPEAQEEEKDEFQKFGFEEAENDGSFVDHVEVDSDNPFAEENAEAAGEVVTMGAANAMNDPKGPQSGYMDPTMQPQSGYMQGQGGSLYASQPLPGQTSGSVQGGGSMYASTPLPGAQNRGGVFQPNNGGVFQPGAQPMQQQMQQQPMQQPYQQQGGYPQQGAYQQQGYPQQGGYQQQGYPQQGGYSQQYQQQYSQPYQAQPYQSQYSHQPSGSVYASQPLPGSQYGGGSQYASQPLPGSQFGGVQHASQPLPGSVPRPNGQPSAQGSQVKESGSAFQDRLNAFVDGGDDKGDKPMSKADVLRQAKEKKKMAKIDAEFKKSMRKKGL